MSQIIYWTNKGQHKKLYNDDKNQMTEIFVIHITPFFSLYKINSVEFVIRSNFVIHFGLGCRNVSHNP